MLICFRPSRIELLVQRSVALTAKRVCGAQEPDAFEDTDDDRDDRAENVVETSEIIDSGDDADEFERASDDRRIAAG